MLKHVREIPQDKILLPGVVITDNVEDYDDFEMTNCLKPTLDMYWQAGGWEESITLRNKLNELKQKTD